MKKLLPLMISVLLLTACDGEVEDLDLQDNVMRSGDLETDTKYVQLCEELACPSCLPDGPQTVLDENGRRVWVPQCPPEGDEGWLCCAGSWADTPCIGIDGPPDGTCPGDYYYCEYYEVGLDGMAVCWDEFGQG